MTLPSYTLVRSKRRSVGLLINAEACLIVRAPLRASVEYIERVLYEKKAWIEKTKARVKAAPRLSPKKFVTGEEFYFLGKLYPLMVVDHGDEPLVFEDGFVLNEKYQKTARALFVAWYKNEAKKYIVQRVTYWAGLYHLNYKSIRISSAEKRWGSCSSKGGLSFNWRLVMAPPSAIDYVVVHELAHLKHLNHARVYWEWVETMCPDYKNEKMWMGNNGRVLAL